MPTISRPFNGKDLKEKERCILSEFKIEAAGKGWLEYKLENEDEDMFYMAVGRHLGLPCRLLDWTSGIDVAMSFLVRDRLDITGTLWVLMFDNRKVQYENIGFSPLSIYDEKLHIVKESNIIPDGKSLSDTPLGIARRYRQNGFFTVTSDKNIDIPHNKINTDGIMFLRIDISSETKSILSPYLQNFGNVNDDSDEKIVSTIMSKYC